MFIQSFIALMSLVSCGAGDQPSQVQEEKTVGPAVFAETPQARLMKILDLNGDGALTKGEFTFVSDNVAFEEADMDSSGVVDEAELRSLVERVTPLKEGYRGRMIHDPAPRQGPASSNNAQPNRKRKRRNRSH